MSAFGAGTNLYSTNTPSKIVAEAKVGDLDVITCATETVLSFNGARVKVDTDENIGSNGSPIRRNGVIVGYVNTAEYGSRMLYFGGAELNTGAGGFMVTRTVSDLLNKRPVTVSTDTVKKLVLQHGQPPIVDGKQAQFMRIGCGSMVSSAYAPHWIRVVDECITIDYDITAKMSTHTTSGLRYGFRDSGITPAGTYSSPGRWFGEPGEGWGGSNITNPDDIFADVDKTKAWPGMRVIVTEPTVERAAFYVADEDLNLDPPADPARGTGCYRSHPQQLRAVPLPMYPSVPVSAAACATSSPMSAPSMSTRPSRMARCSTPFAAVLPTSGKAAASRRNAAWTTAPRVPFPGPHAGRRNAARGHHDKGDLRGDRRLHGCHPHR